LIFRSSSNLNSATQIPLLNTWNSNTSDLLTLSLRKRNINELDTETHDKSGIYL